MRILSSRRILAALAFVLVVSSAQAGIITTDMDRSTPVFTFNIPSQGIVNEGGYVGPNTIRLDGSDPFGGYCTDLFKTIGARDRYAASLQPLSTLANSDLVSKLFAADRLSGNSGGAVSQAGLQLAIWDVVEAGRAGVSPFNPDSSQVVSNEYHVPGLFSISTDQVSLHDTLGRVSYLLTTAQNDNGPGDNLSYIAPAGSYGQGFVTSQAVGRGGETAQAVPEPSTLILSGIGLAGFLAVRFRRWRLGKPLA